MVGGDRRAAAAAAVALGLLLAASAAVAHPEREAGWKRSDLTPVSQPAPAAGRFVLYVARSKVLYVTALDAGSGSTVWTVRASPSGIAPGVAPELTVFGGEVIYLRARGDRLADVAASDARTGRLLWHSPPGEFSGWPTICPDDQTEICLTGALLGHAPTLPLRFDARSGDAVASARAPYSGRELGPNLFDPGGRRPELLVATRRTRIVWTKRLSTIFAASWASSDNGWNFERDERLGLFVGSVGPRLLSHSGSRFTLDLSTMKTVAFRIRDGAVAWRRPGFFACAAAVACPGAPQRGFDTPIAPAAAAATVGVRLVLTGTFTGNGTSHPVVSPNARVVLQGFDPATGRTRWSFDAGRDLGLLTNEAPPPQVAHDAVVIGRRGRLFAVDLRDGRTRPLPTTAAAWCRRAVFYPLSPAYTPSVGPPITQYVGQYALYPCTAAGSRLPVPVRAPAFVGEVGARAAAVVAWSDAGGVVAVPAG